MRLRMLVPICLVLCGCATKNVINLGDGKYKLEYSDPLATPHSAASIFDWELRDHCPAGYTKLKEDVEVRPEGRFFVWVVGCK